MLDSVLRALSVGSITLSAKVPPWICVPLHTLSMSSAWGFTWLPKNDTAPSLALLGWNSLQESPRLRAISFSASSISFVTGILSFDNFAAVMTLAIIESVL